MRSFLRKLVHFAVFSNLWVAFGAACLYGVSVQIHRLSASPRIAWIIFCATLAVYSFQRVFRAAHIYGHDPSVRHNWIVRQRFTLWVLTLFGAAQAVFWSWPLLQPAHLWLLLPAAVIALLYVTPLFPLSGRWFRLRDLPYLKIFLVAGVWTVLTELLPVWVQTGTLLHGPTSVFSAFHRFVFIFAITLPFDLRDLEHDRFHGVTTFASRLGIGPLRSLSNLLLASSAALVLLALALHLIPPGLAGGLAVSALSSAFLVRLIDHRSHELMFGFWLDGTMPDQLFWVLVFQVLV